MTRITIILNAIKAVIYMILLITFTVLVLVAAFRIDTLYGFISITGLGLLWLKHIKIEDRK